MDGAIVYYDYCAFILLCIVGIYFFRTSVHGTIRAYIMTTIVFSTFFGSIVDVVRVYITPLNTVPRLVKFLFHTFYFWDIMFISPLFLLYIIATTDTWHIAFKNKIVAVLLAIPVSVSFVGSIVNFFVPVGFVLNEAGDILYLYGYYCMIISIIFYMVLGLIYINRNREYVDVKRFHIMIVPIVLVAISIVVQALWGRQHVISFVLTVCILMLMLVNRRVEDTVDVTTGMHTYRVFAEDMDTNFKSGKQMELILVNIQNFIYAMRLAGYDNMTNMLSPVSSEILRTMRKRRAQFMCYYNGDGKFAIELSKRHAAQSAEIAGEIAQSIRQNIKLEISDYELAINTCLVSCPEDISDVESLFMLINDIDRIDSQGKVVSASSITGTDEFSMKRDMSTIIDRAITNHYFSVFYQPIYNTKEKKFSSAEALVRLRDPKFGYISPDLFIPLAEKSGAIHAIGSFVLEEVIKFTATSEFEELGVDYIEINLSAMQCLRGDLADEIITLAGKYNVDPKKINLEITETASAYSQEKLYGNIKTLSDYGFTFSLDDFGTGYSNLTRITSLPLSIVKLDRVFVIMEESSGYHMIIKNLIAMLKMLGIKVLVEGVETKEMADNFTEMGVDEIQGFFFSKPLTRSAFTRFVETNNA